MTTKTVRPASLPADLERVITGLSKNSPQQLAGMARTAIDEGNKSARKAVEYWIQAGRILHALKRRVGHGSWMDFLVDKDIHQKTAERYMLLATHDRAVLAAADMSDEPMSLRRALEVAHGDRPDPLEEEIVATDEERAHGTGARNVTPGRKRQDTHSRLMRKMQSVIVELKTAAYEGGGSELTGILGFALAELREIERHVHGVIDAEMGDED